MHRKQIRVTERLKKTNSKWADAVLMLLGYVQSPTSSTELTSTREKLCTRCRYLVIENTNYRN